MYLALNNAFIWKISVRRKYSALFKAFEDILLPDDVIVFGCYEPSDQVVDLMTQIATEVVVPYKLYTDTIALNIDEYPRGRVFTILARDLGNRSLREFLNVGDDELLFFDHALGFRISKPIVPLFMFHDANFEDEAELSGHYFLDDIKSAFTSRGLSLNRVVSDQVNAKW